MNLRPNINYGQIPAADALATSSSFKLATCSKFDSKQIEIKLKLYLRRRKDVWAV